MSAYISGEVATNIADAFFVSATSVADVLTVSASMSPTFVGECERAVNNSTHRTGPPIIEQSDWLTSAKKLAD